MAKTYQIGDLETISGIKTPTIRMWEARYNIITPERSDSNRRTYDETNFKKFLLIAQLYYSNVKISQIAKFTLNELEQKAIELVKTTDEYDPWCNELLSSTIHFNPILFQATINETLMAFDFENTFIFIIAPFLHKIDVLWKGSTIEQIQRNFAFEQTFRFLYRTLNSVEKYIPAEPQKNVMLFCNNDETSLSNLLFAEIIFKKNSYNTTLLKNIDDFEHIYKNIDSFNTKKVVTIAPLNNDLIDNFLNLVKSNKKTTFYFIDTQYRIDANIENLIIINNLDELSDEL